MYIYNHQALNIFNDNMTLKLKAGVIDFNSENEADVEFFHEGEWHVVNVHFKSYFAWGDFENFEIADIEYYDDEGNLKGNIIGKKVVYEQNSENLIYHTIIQAITSSLVENYEKTSRNKKYEPDPDR